uniref:Heparan-sulfate 6-O-sulfotransferase n=1 Tax=Steinernema glaseri TaxID=37863 RepID=A0A1I8AWH9_9BILA
MADEEADVEFAPIDKPAKDTPPVGGPNTGNVAGKAEELTREAGPDYETVADFIAVKAVKLRCSDEQNFMRSSKKLEYAAWALPVASVPILFGVLLIFGVQVLHSMDQKAEIQNFEMCLKTTNWSTWSECVGSPPLRESKRCGLVRRVDCACPPLSICGNHSEVQMMSDADWEVEKDRKQIVFLGKSGFYNVTEFLGTVCDLLGDT